ncbi:MAG: RNA polymerase sigma factor [Pseudomonadales bacterium]
MPQLLPLIRRTVAVQSHPHICYALPPGRRNIGVPALYAITKSRGQKPLDANEPEIAASLVTRIQQGEKLAEEQLVSRYSRGLLSFLRRKTDDDDLADDLHQDTFRIVLERLRAKGLEDPSHLAGFIHATSKNLVIAYFRKQARRKTEPDSEVIESFSHGGTTQSEATMLDEQAKMVRGLLDELRSERDRELLLRFYLDEEDKQSICNALGLTDKHFNRVIFRARERFKELLLKHEKRSNFRVVK